MSQEIIIRWSAALAVWGEAVMTVFRLSFIPSSGPAYLLPVSGCRGPDFECEKISQLRLHRHSSLFRVAMSVLAHMSARCGSLF